MTFGAHADTGRVVLELCRASIGDLADLVAEAQSLWAAESSNAEPGTIGLEEGILQIPWPQEAEDSDIGIVLDGCVPPPPGRTLAFEILRQAFA